MLLPNEDLVSDTPLPQASDYVLYPWLMPGRLTLIVGPTNSGKTTLTLELIANLLKGGHLWDRFPCRAIERVLYLHAEHTLATVQEAAKLRGDIPKGAVRMVHDFASLGTQLITNGQLNKALIKGLVETADDFKPQLIVVEPIAAFLGASENDNLEVRTVINFFANFATRYHAGLISHHHVGKSSFDPEHQRPEGIPVGEARGAMAFEDAAEKVIYIKRAKSSESSSHIKLLTPKPKGFPVADVSLSFDEDALSYTYINTPLSERDLIAVYTRRRKQPSEPLNELVEHFRVLWKCSPNKVMLMLKRARRVGLLTDDPSSQPRV